VPGIVGDLVAAEAAAMLTDGDPILLDDNPAGIGMHVDGPPDR
jgi:hypothetical protein